ncbi:SDR family oxidoreductase [Rummeliibacillus sp. G93]|uniref:elongation factor P 5-aminopentanone reductase n=1 Tax=Rummeliibacillus sp. G93 TaxID=2939494 RepID=UPI00201C0067|nr:SDR family oxidoreductase [Rummeliibacillus sp. G93]UQW98445.1 SDR family oxidoreductase [Rummeliibacillus sp. G93]
MKKFALVLGASGSIGSAICSELAANGWSLYMQYNHNVAGMQQLAEELIQQYPKQEFMPIRADLSKEEAAEQISQSIFTIHAIVIASGHALYKLCEDTDANEMGYLFKVHVETPIQLIGILSQKLRQHEISYVTFIGSIWGEAGGSFESVYSAAKGAIHTFVKAYAKEVAYNGIRVNAVAPGFIETKMNGHLSEDEKASLIEEIPLARGGKPEEVAYLVDFLLSGKADYMTGQILRLNGGWYI